MHVEVLKIIRIHFLFERCYRLSQVATDRAVDAVLRQVFFEIITLFELVASSFGPIEVICLQLAAKLPRPGVNLSSMITAISLRCFLLRY